MQPCSEPCKKPLKCSPKEEGAEPHLCIGVCGEDCIDICRICDPEKFAEIQEIFFGTEEEEDARFVRLKDCSHVFEVSVISFIGFRSLASCCGDPSRSRQM